MRIVRYATPIAVLLLTACTGSAVETAASATVSATGTAMTGAPAAATTTPGSSATAGAPPVDTATPAVGISTAPAVPVGTTTTLAGKVTVRVVKVSPVPVTASGPGDIAGPGVAVRVQVKNGSAEAFDLDGIAVTASYGAGLPAAPAGAGNGTLLGGRLKQGRTAGGVYVFTVPKAFADDVEVQISSSSSPIVVVYQN